MSNSDYYERLAELADALQQPLADLCEAEWHVARICRAIVVTLEEEFSGVLRKQVYLDLSRIVPWAKGRIAKAVEMVEFLHHNGIAQIAESAEIPFDVARRVHRSALAPSRKLRAFRLVQKRYEERSHLANEEEVEKYIGKEKAKQAKDVTKFDAEIKERERNRKMIARIIRTRTGGPDDEFTKILLGPMRKYMEATGGMSAL